MKHRIALLGFGVVGQGFAEILKNKKQVLEEQFGLDAAIVAVSDVMKGSVYHPDGLSIEDLLAVVKETGKLDDYPEQEGGGRGGERFLKKKQKKTKKKFSITITP
nr:hypothetical protein [Bacilli bacterium]